MASHLPPPGRSLVPPPVDSLADQWQWALSQSRDDLHSTASRAASIPGLDYAARIWNWLAPRINDNRRIGDCEPLEPHRFWCPILLAHESSQHPGHLGFASTVPTHLPGGSDGDLNVLSRAAALLGVDATASIDVRLVEPFHAEGTSHTLSFLVSLLARVLRRTLPPEVAATGCWSDERAELSPVTGGTLWNNKLAIATAWGYRRILVVTGQAALHREPHASLELLSVPTRLESALPRIAYHVWGEDAAEEVRDRMSGPFAEVIDRSANECLGRHRFVRLIRSQLEKCGLGGLVWLRGEPWSGKTTVLGALAREMSVGRTKWKTAPFFAGTEYDTIESFWEHMTQMLARICRTRPDHPADPPRAQYHSMLAKVRARRDCANGQLPPIVMIVDDIDAVSTAESSKRAELLKEVKLAADHGISAVVSSHSFPSDRNEWDRTIELQPVHPGVFEKMIYGLPEETLHEVKKAWTRRRGTERRSEHCSVKEIASHLHKRWHGRPGYMRYLTKEWSGGRISLSDSDLPEEWYRIVDNTLNNLSHEQLTFIVLLATARQPLSAHQIRSVLPGLDPDASLWSLQSLLRPVRDGLTLRWHIEDRDIRQRVLDTQESLALGVEQQMAEWCARWREHKDPYALRNVAHHLCRARRENDLLHLALDKDSSFFHACRTHIAFDADALLQPSRLALPWSLEHRSVRHSIMLLLGTAERRAQLLAERTPLDVLRHQGAWAALEWIEALAIHEEAKRLWALVLVIEVPVDDPLGPVAIVNSLFLGEHIRLSGKTSGCALALATAACLRRDLSEAQRKELCAIICTNLHPDKQARFAGLLGRRDATLAEIPTDSLRTLYDHQLRRHGVHSPNVRQSLIKALKHLAESHARHGATDKALAVVEELWKIKPAEAAWALAESVLNGVVKCERVGEAEDVVHRLFKMERAFFKKVAGHTLNEQLCEAFGKVAYLHALDGHRQRAAKFIAQAEDRVGRMPSRKKVDFTSRVALWAARAHFVEHSEHLFNAAILFAQKLAEDDEIAEALFFIGMRAGQAAETAPALKDCGRNAAELLEVRLSQMQCATYKLDNNTFNIRLAGLAKTFGHLGETDRALNLLFNARRDTAGAARGEALSELVRLEAARGGDVDVVVVRQNNHPFTAIERYLEDLVESGEVPAAKSLIVRYLHREVSKDGAHKWGPVDMLLYLALAAHRLGQSECAQTLVVGYLACFRESQQDAVSRCDLGTVYWKQQTAWCRIALGSVYWKIGSSDRAKRTLLRAEKVIRREVTRRPTKRWFQLLAALATAQHGAGFNDDACGTCAVMDEVAQSMIISSGGIGNNHRVVEEIVEASALCGASDRWACWLRRIVEETELSRDGSVEGRRRTGISTRLARMAACAARAATFDSTGIDTAKDFIAFVAQRTGTRTAHVRRANAIMQVLGKEDQGTAEAWDMVRSITSPDAREKAAGDVIAAAIQCQRKEDLIGLASQLREGKRLKKVLQSLAEAGDLDRLRKAIPLAANSLESAYWGSYLLLEHDERLSVDDLRQLVDKFTSVGINQK